MVNEEKNLQKRRRKYPFRTVRGGRTRREAIQARYRGPNRNLGLNRARNTERVGKSGRDLSVIGRAIRGRTPAGPAVGKKMLYFSELKKRGEIKKSKNRKEEKRVTAGGLALRKAGKGKAKISAEKSAHLDRMGVQKGENKPALLKGNGDRGTGKR